MLRQAPPGQATAVQGLDGRRRASVGRQGSGGVVDGAAQVPPTQKNGWNNLEDLVKPRVYEKSGARDFWENQGKIIVEAMKKRRDFHENLEKMQFTYEQIEKYLGI